MLTIPDINELIKDLNGELFPFGWVKLLWRLRKPRTRRLRVPLMGVAKKLHAAAPGEPARLHADRVSPAATASAKYRRQGIGEFGWILEDNKGMLSIAELPGARRSTTATGFTRRRSLAELDPGRRVVARFLLAPRPFVDAGASQPVGGLGRAQQMVDAEARVALPAAGGVVPEGVELLLVGMERAQRVGPALVDDAAPRRARSPAASAASCCVARTEKTSRSSGTTFQSPASTTGRSSASSSRGMRAPAAPSTSACSRTSRCRPDCRWADRASRRSTPVRPRPRYSGCGCRRDRRGGRRAAAPGAVALRQDRDSVEALLPVPHRAVAGRLDVGDRQRLVGAFQFLQADDIGLLALEPFEQPRQPRADAVDVVGGELHAAALSGADAPVTVETVRSCCR